ncbi:MAG: HAD hydrolase-like protein [Deltaproteobacteria bacterium]|jgi:phosphoglycolate phosphatase|nr:HAD hydrolase-like protein [Deltaproteobacteria bacterium]
MTIIRPGETKAVLLDFDMTLVDSSYAIVKAHNLFAEDLGLRKITRDELLSSIGQTLEASWDDFWGHHEPEWSQIYQTKYQKVETSNFQLFSDTISTLKTIRAAGLKTAVVTNRWLAGQAVDQCGLNGFFDAVVGAEEVEHPKPNAEPILKALELLEIARPQAVYAGDSDIDMKTAVASGVDGIGVATGAKTSEELLQAGAKWAGRSLGEILPLIGLS